MSSVFLKNIGSEKRCLFTPKIEIENDNTLKTSLPWREDLKGGGTKWVMVNYFSPLTPTLSRQKRVIYKKINN